MIMPLKNKFVVWSPKSLDLGVSNFFKSLLFLTPKFKDLGLQPASNKLNYKTFMLCCDNNESKKFRHKFNMF